MTEHNNKNPEFLSRQLMIADATELLNELSAICNDKPLHVVLIAIGKLHSDVAVHFSHNSKAEAIDLLKLWVHSLENAK